MLKIQTTIANSYVLKDIIDALAKMDTDDDFNGFNGSECLWDVTKEEGYECNKDYVLHRVYKEFKDKELTSLYKGAFVNQVVSMFAKLWCGDDSYYNDYDVNTEVLDDGKFYIVIANYHVD